MTLTLVLAGFVGVLVAALVGLYIHDRWFCHDNIIRNYPISGHFRYLLIALGPKLRQYIVADNREELPFNRDERDWIYRSADGENNYFGFGTDDQILSIGYPIIKHAVFPHGEESFTGGAHDTMHEVAAAVTLGDTHDRRRSWRPTSIVNISAMSYGALGSHAVEALNRGAKQAGCYHNTGEGGISPFHKLGADLVYQIGTGYFGCRSADGRFSMDKLRKKLESAPTVRGIEVKLSQGRSPVKAACCRATR